MKISVIIPSYNPGSYFSECINSLYQQNLPFNMWEIIIILNGNVTLYKNYIEEVLQTKPKELMTTLICTETPGVSNARNMGLNKATGEYICFIDDDDIVSPNYLYKLLSIANKENIVISNIYSFVKNINEKRTNFFVCNKLKESSIYNHASLFKNRSFLAFPVAKIIHRNIIGDRRYDKRFKNGEDALFITSITDRVKDICFTLDATYYVRERTGSATRKKIPYRELIHHTFLLIIEYINIYFKNPFKYNFLLFLSRIPGVIKGAILLAKNNI